MLKRILGILFTYLKKCAKVIEEQMDKMILFDLQDEEEFDDVFDSLIEDQENDEEEKVYPVMTARTAPFQCSETFIKDNPTKEEKEEMIQEIVSEFGGMPGFYTFHFDVLESNYFDVQYGDISTFITDDCDTNDRVEDVLRERSNKNKKGKHLARKRIKKKN